MRAARGADAAGNGNMPISGLWLLLALLFVAHADPGPVHLPHCQDSNREAVVFQDSACASQSQAQRRLCNGIKRIQQATCAELGSEQFMIDVISSIGLCPDGRGSKLYGNFTKAMVAVAAEGGGKGDERRVGLWQNPAQIAPALIHIASLSHKTRSYVEVGVYSMWTTAVAAAYFRRTSSGEFSGQAVDITSSYSTKATMAQLKALNVAFVGRATAAGKRLFAGSVKPLYDLCFIDAGHSYSDIRKDFAEAAPYCRRIMLHDIQDSNILHIDGFSGGVPLFWAHLKRHTKAHRLTEFVEQPGVHFSKFFGLGIVGPNAAGTAEPEDPVESWPAWKGTGKPDGLKAELCRSGSAPPPICAFIDLYSQPKNYEFQGWSRRPGG